jgi:ferric-dicitrate binding protein FerR (iron transport regulator)
MENNFKNILYMELEKLLADIEKMKNDPKEASEAFEAASRKVSMKNGSLGIRRMMEYLPRVAAILFLPLVAGLITVLMIFGTQDSPVWSEISVPNGETREITLPDGTELTLNAGSRITFPDRFEGNTRELFLDGELLADVTTDKKKPFIIHAGEHTLKVLGTKFTFKSYKDSELTEVMLLEGSVQLEFKGEECTRNVLMQPGEHVRFDRHTGLIETRRFQEEMFGMFASGTALSFSNVPLSEVAKDLEHTFNEKILILDEKAAKTKVLAFFTDDTSCADILASLEATYPEMTVKNISGTYYITSK